MSFTGEKIGKFSWEDPFLLTEQLSEEERLKTFRFGGSRALF